MKVLCDHMLGSLATWLRILGIDTLYPSDKMSDEGILQIATQEQRLIISRDKQLIVRAKKRMIPVLELHSTSLGDQLQTVFNSLAIETSRILTRCTHCNTQLLSIEKNKITDQVPPKVRATQKDFWYCPHCQKYYWMGTHYQSMMQKIKLLQKEP